MIKATHSAWLASMVQQAAAPELMGERIKELQAKGFRRVEGTPDVWEYRGTRREAEAIAREVLGEGAIRQWLVTPGKAFKPGTPLWAIIVDGWSRGFYPFQTLAEARAQGYVVSLEWIQAHWDRLTQEMYEFEANCRTSLEE